MKRLGLRLKFGLVIVVLFALIFGVAGAVLIKQNIHNLRDDLNTKSKVFAALATTPIGNTFLTYQDSGRIKITQQIQNFTTLNDSITDVAVVDTGGSIAFNQERHQAVTLDSQTDSTFTTVYNYDPSGIIDRIVVPLIEDNGSHRYNIVYFISSASLLTTIHHTETTIVSSVLTGLLASAIIAYLLISWWFLAPIQQVSRQALTISLGHLDQQITVKSSDEVGDLAMAVNSMAESLKANIVQLREADRLKTEFLMISSHNLRTPLTVINGYIDELKKFDVNTNARYLLDTISVSSKRLTAFAEDMLTITNVEAGKDIMQKRPSELAELLHDMSNDFVILARQKDITFTADITTGGHRADISPAHLRSAIWNLLDNALKFTAGSGWIKLEAKPVGSNVEISIADSGIGISKEEVPRLFTKFHRGTSTTQYDYEGTGIGLYATKLVIEHLGGTIVANSELNHGATFTITLPML